MRSNMAGNVRLYKKMLAEIEGWDKLAEPGSKSYLDHIAYSFNDAPFHGWGGKALADERDCYLHVQDTYFKLVAVLKEAIGPDDGAWIDPVTPPYPGTER